MFLKSSLLLSIALLFNSCCKKVNCGENVDNVPSIYIEFDTLAPADLTTVVYTLQNNVIIDSAVYTFYYEALQFSPFKFVYDTDVDQKTFVVKHNSKTDTIYDVKCTFIPERAVCNQCFFSGTQYTTFWRYTDFSFKHKNKTYTQNDLFVLEY